MTADEDIRRKRAADVYGGWDGAAAAGAPPPGSPTGVGGTAPAPAPAPAHGTGFINLSQYLGANQGGAQGMANTIGGNVAQQGAQTMADAAKYQHELKTSLMPTAEQVDPTLQAKLGKEATQASMSAQALQSPGGIGALLTNQYGAGGGYGSGMRGFDTFLTGSAGGNQFQQLGNQYGGLDKYVSGLGGGYTPIVAGSGKGTGGGMAKPAAPAAPSGPAPVAGPGPGVGGAEPGGASERRKRRAF